ncbi:MAG: AAA family ATPase [Candidatus Lokiarchaeia archaeon]
MKMEDIRNFLSEASEEEIEHLKRIVKYEDREQKEINRDSDLKGCLPWWRLNDTLVPWQLVKKLRLQNIVIAQGGRRKVYYLASRKKVKKALAEYKKAQKIQEKQEQQPKIITARSKIPKDIFKPISGYEDVKKLFIKSLEAKNPVHILLVGPPASAKTLFLLEIARLGGASYLLGGGTTKVGLTDQLFTLKPNYVLLDEADKMDKDDYTAMLSLMETGIVKEVKHDKNREITLQSKVYAACNDENNLPNELLSRFAFILYFKAYTKKQFEDATIKVLTIREGKSKELAKYIATKVATFTKDVRKAIGVARVSNTKEDADFATEVQKRYAKPT